VLDAQYFGVAQRRRRVFVVGCLGDWRSAAEVLFEPESLRRDSAPSREKGQEVAGTIAARFGISRNNHEECVIAKCLTRGIGQRLDAETETMVAIALAENTIGRQPQNGGNGDGFTVGGPMYTLNATGVHGVAQTIAFQLNGDRNNPGVSVSEDRAFCLPANPMSDRGQAVVHPTAYAFDSLSSNSMKSSNPISGVNEVSVSKTLDTSRGLDPSCNQGGLGLVQSMAVRRLTPTECERLQGFPDSYTNIPWRKKEESPDGPRYKALGNSMAVPVMAWIGRRIANAP